jgi:hypothetical protein
MMMSELSLEMRLAARVLILIDFAEVRGQSRVGGGGGLSGPLSTLWEKITNRGRVAEWPVTDPILPVLVLTQDNARAKSIAR